MRSSSSAFDPKVLDNDPEVTVPTFDAAKYSVRMLCVTVGEGNRAVEAVLYDLIASVGIPKDAFGIALA
jgi:hypothetical protein